MPSSLQSLKVSLYELMMDHIQSKPDNNDIDENNWWYQYRFNIEPQLSEVIADNDYGQILNYNQDTNQKLIDEIVESKSNLK